eukprot:4565412-Ditylum_brightwellii.AAC.1
MEHYRCYRFHIPSTGRHCIVATAEFFPQHCCMPAFLFADAATAAANNLIEALQRPALASPFAPLSKNHLCTIKDLATIFNNATKEHCNQHNILLEPPRVDITAKQPQPVTT